MHILKGACTALSCLLLTAQFSVSAAEKPDLPTTFNAKSQTKLKYEDMDYLLEKTVLPLGRSDHKPARRVKGNTGTGTRLIRDNPEASRLEGNRIMFHFIETNEQEFVVREVRDVLLSFPEKIDLTKLNRDEQLAYWLNLHNSIVYAEIADRYPITKINPLYGECPEEQDKFYCARTHNLNGQLISPFDIRQHVLDNWDNPVVIYGFFLGSVGSPNIRTKAYTGETIWADLEDNAKDFVNSVRGTRIKEDDHTLRVSTYYQDVAQMFPNFEKDLLAHINAYAVRDFRFQLGPVDAIEVYIDDWYIADLYNGYVRTAGNGANFQVTGRGGLRADLSAYPPHVQRLLAGVIKRNLNRRGIVDIETVNKGMSSDEMDEEIEVAPQEPESR